MPWRVYRPGLVVGDSKTGEMDKIDGPYYFFKLIQRMRSHPAAVDAGGRHRGRPHQHRAGGLRRRRDRPHRAQEGPRRQGVPPRRPDAVPRRRHPEHLRQGGARAAVLAARQRRAARLHPEQRQEGHARADAGAPDQERRHEGPRRSGRHPHVRQLPDALRRARDDRRAEGHEDPVPAAGGLRVPAVGLLGAQPRPGSLHRPHAQGPGAGQGGGDHRRLVGHRPGGGAQDRATPARSP